MKNQKGFTLIGVLVMIAIMGVVMSGLCQLAAYSIRISTTARIDSDIMAYVSVLRSKLEINGVLSDNDTTKGQGWSVKHILQSSQIVGTKTLVSYRATFTRNPDSIIGPKVISREISTVTIDTPKPISKQDDNDHDRDSGCDHR